MAPPQIGALLIGVWWTTNGIGALFVDPNFSTAHVRGGGEIVGVAITANGWHALFHLLPGLVGIAAASRPGAAITYLLVSGAIYILVGGLGLIAGGSSLGLIAVDAPGDVVHLAEGVIAFTLGVSAANTRARRVRLQARPES